MKYVLLFWQELQYPEYILFDLKIELVVSN